ncbi:MAG TPA: metal-dependent transcriptional regulator [Anaerolineales bacterium]|nr:metal-dependent transcriptional regulator [Anaerolineales bacterium]
MAVDMGPSPEMYVKSLFELARGRTPVPISALAGRLGHSVVSATEMIHRLERHGLVTHQPYRGVRLTPAGAGHARTLLRRHRVWERFLTDELQLPWESVHDLACQLEHVVGEEVTEALDRRLGSPKTCPHGNVIPRPSTGPLPPGPTLADLQAGDEARLVAVHPESRSVLGYLARHGLRPGVVLRLESVEATDGLRLVRTSSGAVTFGPELAAHLRVQITQRAPAKSRTLPRR